MASKCRLNTLPEVRFFHNYQRATYKTTTNLVSRVLEATQTVTDFIFLCFLCTTSLIYCKIHKFCLNRPECPAATPRPSCAQHAPAAPSNASWLPRAVYHVCPGPGTGGRVLATVLGPQRPTLAGAREMRVASTGKGCPLI